MNERLILITSGRGPAECCWVVAKVLKHFLAALEAAGAKAEVVQKQAGIESRTIQSVVIRIEEKAGLESLLNEWVGTIQWIGQCTFRRHHKRKNWFVALAELKDADLAINLNEVRIDTMRSSGKGGQHVNKVNSAVRATHLPTGVVALASDQRSQMQNKKMAITRLRLKLEDWRNQQLGAQDYENWASKIQFERGNPVKIFKGTDFKTEKTLKKNKNSRRENKNILQTEMKLLL